jgi:hypothetical protein
LPETVTIQIAQQVGGTYGSASASGSDITVPAGKAVSVSTTAGALRLQAGGAVAGNRVFTYTGSRGP